METDRNLKETLRDRDNIEIIAVFGGYEGAIGSIMIRRMRAQADQRAALPVRTAPRTAPRTLAYRVNL